MKSADEHVLTGGAVESQLILERYRPLSHLGQGGFGTVVLAWDTRMQRRVAIKRLPLPVDKRGIPQHPPGLAEARTAAMLNHPSIVTVFDFDTDVDEAFLVMEHIDGASLSEILDQADGALTTDEAANVIASIADALEFAHDNGVLHLDIKPDNVLVTRDGRVKVADFGMAELSSLSGHGPAEGGTPGYMPIEQLEGGTVSEQTDVWAFAALAFEVLTGVNPFIQDSMQSAIVQLQTLTVPRATDYLPQLTPQTDDVFFSALALRPRDRFPDVSTFADELVPLLGDPAVGRESLAAWIDEFTEEDENLMEPGLSTLGLWDRLQGRLGGMLVRAAAAVEAGWLAWSGLVPFGLERGALLAAVGLVGAAGVLAPSLGVGLGLTFLIVGLFAAQAWAVAAVTLVLGGAWWWFFARRHTGAAVLPLAAPVLAAARLSPAQPLLAGFALRPGQAAVTGLLGGALTMLASAGSANGAPYVAVWAPYALDVWHADLAVAGLRTLVSSPESYVALAAWPLSAFLMSLACSRATRLGAFVGTLGASATFWGTYYLAGETARLLGRPQQWATTELAISVGASLILMLLVVLLGAPLRPEEDATFDDYETPEG